MLIIDNVENLDTRSRQLTESMGENSVIYHAPNPADDTDLMNYSNTLGSI